MGRFSRYLTDTAAYFKRLPNSPRGDARFDKPKPIPCRVRFKTREVLDAAGQKRISTGTIITGAELVPGSRIEYMGRNAIIIECRPCLDLDGNLDHWEGVF